jgi:hypothetical protein
MFEILNCRKLNLQSEESIRETVLRAYRERYNNFGPAFVVEKLKEQEGIVIGASSLRRQLEKEMRVAGTSMIEQVTRFLEEPYLAKMNGKFSRPAADCEDAHVSLGTANLTDILYFIIL